MNRYELHKLASIQALINQRKSEGYSHSAVLSAVERELVIYDKVVEDNGIGYYTILTPYKLVAGKREYTVPEHADIPRRAWGAKTQDRQIAFLLEKVEDVSRDI